MKSARSREHAAAGVATSGTGEVDGRATRWNEHKAQRKARVLDAAVAAIEEEGPGIGVKQIADRAAMPRPVVYRHFKDRNDLDEQIRAHVLEKLMKRLRPVLEPEGTVEEAIRRAVDSYMQWITEHPRLHQFLGSGSASSAGQRSRVVSGAKTAIARRVTAIFTTALSSYGKDSAVAESLAFGLVGLVDAAVNRWQSHPESHALTAEQLSDFLSTSIWHVLDGNLRSLGVELTVSTPIGEFLTGFAGAEAKPD